MMQQMGMGMPQQGSQQQTMMLQQLQKMSGQMQKLQTTIDAVQSQAQGVSKAAETRQMILEQRITSLERRIERVEKTSDKLRDTFQGVDFDEIMRLPGRISDAVTIQAGRLHGEGMAEITQYRADVGRLAEELGSQLHRERGLHELVDRMETECVPSIGDLRATAGSEELALAPNFAKMHDMVEKFYSQSAAKVSAGLKAPKVD